MDTCIHRFFFLSHPYPHHAILHPLLQHTTTHSIAFRNKNFMNMFRQVSHYITSNCIRIDSQYLPWPVPRLLWLLQAPDYHPSTPDTLCTMLIGYTTFPSFPCPIFRQWHCSPHNVDINNSSIHGSWFRKEVIIAPKSLAIIPSFNISLHQCILFYYVSLILTQFPIYVFYSFTIMFCKA